MLSLLLLLTLTGCSISRKPLIITQYKSTEIIHLREKQYLACTEFIIENPNPYYVKLKSLSYGFQGNNTQGVTDDFSIRNIRLDEFGAYRWKSVMPVTGTLNTELKDQKIKGWLDAKIRGKRVRTHF